jgi:hypothetical protein
MPAPQKAKKEQTLYLVTIEGEYYATVGGQKAIKPYKVELKMDEMAKQAGFLSAALQKLGDNDALLVRVLRARHPDYKRYRTHHQTNVLNLTTGEPPKELGLMNRKQIISFLSINPEVPIETDLYPQIEELRQALRDWQDNPESFLKRQEARKTLRGPEFALAKSLDALNPGIDTPQFTEAEKIAAVSAAPVPLFNPEAALPAYEPTPVAQYEPRWEEPDPDPPLQDELIQPQAPGVLREYQLKKSFKELGV